MATGGCLNVDLLIEHAFLGISHGRQCFCGWAVPATVKIVWPAWVEHVRSIAAQREPKGEPGVCSGLEAVHYLATGRRPGLDPVVAGGG